MKACDVLYRAVMKNSRKWNNERDVMKNGIRQVVECWSAVYRVRLVVVPRVVPRRKARREIPERD